MSVKMLAEKEDKYRKIIGQLLDKGMYVIDSTDYSKIETMLEDLLELGYVCYFDTDRRIFLGKKIHYICKLRNGESDFTKAEPILVGTIDMLNDMYGFNYKTIEEFMNDLLCLMEAGIDYYLTEATAVEFEKALINRNL